MKTIQLLVVLLAALLTVPSSAQDGGSGGVLVIVLVIIASLLCTILLIIFLYWIRKKIRKMREIKKTGARDPMTSVSHPSNPRGPVVGYDNKRTSTFVSNTHGSPEGRTTQPYTRVGDNESHGIGPMNGMANKMASTSMTHVNSSTTMGHYPTGSVLHSDIANGANLAKMARNVAEWEGILASVGTDANNSQQQQQPGAQGVTNSGNNNNNNNGNNNGDNINNNNNGQNRTKHGRNGGSVEITGAPLSGPITSSSGSDSYSGSPPDANLVNNGMGMNLMANNQNIHRNKNQRHNNNNRGHNQQRQHNQQQIGINQQIPQLTPQQIQAINIQMSKLMQMGPQGQLQAQNLAFQLQLLMAGQVNNLYQQDGSININNNGIPGNQINNIPGTNGINGQHKQQKMDENQLRFIRGITEKVPLVRISDLRFNLEIGRGKFGKVFDAIWDQKRVAVKLFKQDEINEECFEDFKKEIDVAALLPKHDNVLKIFAFTVNPYSIIEEYLNGGSVEIAVSSQHRKSKRMDYVLADIIQMLQHAAKGIKHLHSANIVHRDIAARNLLLNEETYQSPVMEEMIDPNDPTKRITTVSTTLKKKRRVVVCDFGLSRITESAAKNSYTSSHVGPLKWMSPESIQKQVYNTKTDAYSFGIVIWEVLTGVPPYPDMKVVNVAVEVLYKSTRPCIPQWFPREIQYLMQRCWQTVPEYRPTFDEIVTELQEFRKKLKSISKKIGPYDPNFPFPLVTDTRFPQPTSKLVELPQLEEEYKDILTDYHKKCIEQAYIRHEKWEKEQVRKERQKKMFEQQKMQLSSVNSNHTNSGHSTHPTNSGHSHHSASGGGGGSGNVNNNGNDRNNHNNHNNNNNNSQQKPTMQHMQSLPTNSHTTNTHTGHTTNSQGSHHGSHHGSHPTNSNDNTNKDKNYISTMSDMSYDTNSGIQGQSAGSTYALAQTSLVPSVESGNSALPLIGGGDNNQVSYKILPTTSTNSSVNNSNHNSNNIHSNHISNLVNNNNNNNVNSLNNNISNNTININDSKHNSIIINNQNGGVINTVGNINGVSMERNESVPHMGLNMSHTRESIAIHNATGHKINVSNAISNNTNIDLHTKLRNQDSHSLSRDSTSRTASMQPNPQEFLPVTTMSQMSQRLTNISLNVGDAGMDSRTSMQLNFENDQTKHNLYLQTGVPAHQQFESIDVSNNNTPIVSDQLHDLSGRQPAQTPPL